MFRAFAFIAGCIFGVAWTLMAERMNLPAFGLFALLGGGAILMVVITALLSWESA